MPVNPVDMESHPRSAARLMKSTGGSPKTLSCSIPSRRIRPRLIASHPAWVDDVADRCERTRHLSDRFGDGCKADTLAQPRPDIDRAVRNGAKGKLRALFLLAGREVHG